MKSKVKFLSWMLFSALFAISFSACSDDDSGYEEQVKGTYGGTLYSHVEGVGYVQYIESMQIKVEATGENKATVKTSLDLTELIGQSLNISCPVNLTFDNDNQEYIAHGTTTVPEMGNLSVVVEGYFKTNNKVELYIYPEGMDFKFLGTKQ